MIPFWHRFPQLTQGLSLGWNRRTIHRDERKVCMAFSML